MYNNGQLAATGIAALVIGGIALDLGWVLVASLSLAIIGVVLVRFTFQRQSAHEDAPADPDPDHVAAASTAER